MPQHLLEGYVEPDNHDETSTGALYNRIEQLESELEASQAKLREAKNRFVAMERSLAELRKQLSPLHKALRMIFGELDAAGIQDSHQEVTGSANPRMAAAWDIWIKKLGGKQAEFHSGDAGARRNDRTAT